MGTQKLEIFDRFWVLAYIQPLSYILEFRYLVSYHRKLKHLFKVLVMLLVSCYPTNSKRSDYFLTLIRLNVKENVTTVHNRK